MDMRREGSLEERREGIMTNDEIPNDERSPKSE
jgi:hypothetical protein